MKLRVRLSAIFDRILDISAVLSDLLLAAMGIMILFEVIFRTVFVRSGPIVDITQILISYIPFLGAAWLLREEGHASVSIVYDRLSKKAQAVMSTITSILGILIGLILFWFGALSTWSQYVKDLRVLSNLNEPYLIYTIIVPICGFLLTIQFIRRTWQSWSLWKKET